MNQLDLTDIYRTVHRTTEKYTFFSSAIGIFTKIDHILGQKGRLNKLKGFRPHKVSSLTTMILWSAL